MNSSCYDKQEALRHFFAYVGQFQLNSSGGNAQNFWKSKLAQLQLEMAQ